MTIKYSDNDCVKIKTYMGHNQIRFSQQETELLQKFLPDLKNIYYHTELKGYGSISVLLDKPYRRTSQNLGYHLGNETAKTVEVSMPASLNFVHIKHSKNITVFYLGSETSFHLFDSNVGNTSVPVWIFADKTGILISKDEPEGRARGSSEDKKPLPTLQ